MTYYDDLLAVGIGAVVTGLLLWFFFGPKRAKTTELRGGVQEVEVTVRGGYSPDVRSEEHTSELQSLMRISYAVFCLNKKMNAQNAIITTTTEITHHKRTSKHQS